jgi:hypothetical protein
MLFHGTIPDEAPMSRELMEPPEAPQRAEKALKAAEQTLEEGVVGRRS